MLSTPRLCYNKNMKNSLHYNVLFRPNPEGGFTAVVPSLPGCVSHGATLEEARTMVTDAILGYVVSLKKHNEEIPSDNDGFIASVEVSDEAYA